MTRRAIRRRGRLGTGVLAVALLAPAADTTLATEPAPEQESEYEGGNDPESQDGAGAGPEDLSSGQDPGTSLQDESSPPLVGSGPAANSEEGESEDGPVETLVDGEPVATPTPGPNPAPPPTAPSPPKPAAPAPGDQAPRLPSQAEQPVPAPKSGIAPLRREAKPRADRGGKSKARKRAARPGAGRPFAVTRGGNAAAPRAAAPGAPVPTAPAPPSPPAAVQAPAGATTYTVRSGDTLWAIAANRLGDDASPARVAREVQRLWDLNAEAIGTGDPSLIRAGVELRLE